MQTFKIILLILLNTPNYPTHAGKIWVSDNNKIHLAKKVQLRMRRADEHDSLLKIKVLKLSKRAADEFSKTSEQMHAPSLLELLAKLKEEYAGEEKKLDAKEVKSSLDKLTAKFAALSKIPRHPKAEPADILRQLSEEVLDDEAGVFTGDFYSDDEYVEEEDSSDPSLLALQLWNSKKSSDSSEWDW